MYIKPLEGIRVLDVSRVLAGPFCTMILGDLGAEVIKVEEPVKGDETRSWGPPFINGESAYYLSINRNKKSITVNLKSEEGIEIIYRLAERSDVFIENFRPGVAERLKIDYDSIKKINPKIIYCSISGFGQTGPYRDYPAYDLLIQAMSGFMSITGEEGRPPVRIGVALFDIGAAMYAAIAIIAALYRREKIGVGERIDISLLDTGVSWLTYMAMNYFATGENPKKMGSAHPSIVPYQCFKDKNGKYFAVAVGNDEHWRKMCKSLGKEEWINDERYITNPNRVKNRYELLAELNKIFESNTREYWLKVLMENSVPCAPVNEVSEILSDPQVIHREMVKEINHPKLGLIKQLGIPIKYANTKLEIKDPPPTLGQHTEEVLMKILGYDKEKILDLKKRGVI
ncbi:MAG: CaiB/BaiF CoA-transferase family protein [Candidatus Methanomethylicia archaeon]